MEEYELLEKSGNIGFYESCEVTEIFLHNTKTKDNVNFFTLAVFEEKPFENNKIKFITKKLIPIKKSEFKIGIVQYSLSLKDMKTNFKSLQNNKKWISNQEIEPSKELSHLRFIPKQFVPVSDDFKEIRLNKVLKNNFNNGSYILEFFKEDKNDFDFILKDDEKFDNINKKINEYLPINLYSVRDRIGNFIFQFPITILDLYCNTPSEECKIEFGFAWHPKISELPNCLIEISSYLDGIVMGDSIEEYNKKSTQLIDIGNLYYPSRIIKIWRLKPKLLIYYHNGGFTKFKYNFSIFYGYRQFPNFDDKSKMEKIDIFKQDYQSSTHKEYFDFINNTKDLIEKEELEKKLIFKQYKSLNNHELALEDLRSLIKSKCKNGVYLWDPFLGPEEIFKTLFYSNILDVPLKALGSFNEKKILEYNEKFENLKSNKLGLNLEFRAQHDEYGKKFHDRFLIFPGNEIFFEKPDVYSLGTSVNSFGKNKYHILQKVSYPQAVLNAFNDLWNQLDSKECLVWKIS